MDDRLIEIMASLHEAQKALNEELHPLLKAQNVPYIARRSMDEHKVRTCSTRHGMHAATFQFD